MAMKREVKEETGLKIEIKKPVGTYLEREGRVQAFVVTYLCKKKQGKVHLSHEHTKFKWVTLQELRKMKTEPYIKDLFRKGAIR